MARPFPHRLTQRRIGVYIPMAGKLDKSQREKFEEAARKFGADGDEHTYESIIAKVGKTPKLSDDKIKEFAQQFRSDAKGQRP